MGKLVLRRAGWAVFVVSIVVTVVFVLVHWVGDPCVAKLGPSARPEHWTHSSPARWRRC